MAFNDIFRDAFDIGKLKELLFKKVVLKIYGDFFELF